MKSVEYKCKKEMLKELKKQLADIQNDHDKYEGEIREINQFVQKLAEEADLVTIELDKVEDMKQGGNSMEEILRYLNQKFKLDDKYGIVQEGEKQKVIKKWKI